MPYCSHCGANAAADQRFCQACGRALDSAPAAPHDPPVPAAVGVDEQQPSGGFAPLAPPPAPHEYQYVGGPVEPESSAGRSGNLGRILAIGAVVVALAGGAFLAYTAFFNKSGADSPEAAVTQMFQAVADQDGVEALRMLNPGETDGFGDVYESLQKRVADAGFASNANGEVLEAVTINLENLKVETEKKGENAARVYIVDGDLKITIDEGKLPDDFKDLYGQLDSEILDELKNIDIGEVVGDIAESEDVRPFLTTIKQDGRWYVSPIATVGEYLVDDSDQGELSAADFDKVAEENAPDPKTSKDPQGALNILVDAISSEDINQIFAALPQDEVAALRPFGNILGDGLKGSGIDLRLSDLDTSFEELDDDLGRLTIKRGTLEGTIDGDEGKVSVDGICFEITEDREVYDGSGTETSTESDCLPDEVRDEAGIDAITFILHKEDGGWQVDPRATVIDYAKNAIESVNESTLRDILKPYNFNEEDR